MASTHAHDHAHGAPSHAPGHDHGHDHGHGHGHGHDHDHGHGHGHGDGPRDSSEGSVMLCFCAAAVVALLGAAWGRPKAHDAKGHGHAAAAHAPELREAVGTGGAVATSAPEATEAALAVLREGGNAADGLVAASFVLAVVRPQSTGIGGGGFALYHDAARRATSAVDGREVAPREATPRMFLDARGEVDEAASKDGPTAAAVPGLVAMLAELHEKHGSGKIGWKRLLEPAIRHAREGFVVKAGLARAIGERRAVLGRYPASAALFLPNGRAPEVGAKLANPELARTLEAIAEHGPRGFYEGWVAERIEQAVRAQGGRISAADLAGYRATTPTPVTGTYRGMKVASFPLPSSGGVLLVHMLNVMSGWDLRAKGWHSADHLHLLAETMRHAYADRARHLGDVGDGPEAQRVTGWLTSPEYAAQVRQGIDPRQATPSREVQGGVPPRERGHTTHISVVDAAGNACSSTQTINTGLGSGFVVAGTGVLLNNEMDDFAAKAGASNAFGLAGGEKNLPGPGKRPLSSMSPTIVTDAQGRVRLVVGSPGGGRIITSVLQVVSNVIDFDMNLHQAIDSPRIHHQWTPDELLVEPDLAHTKVDALAVRGHSIHRLDRRGIGEVNAVLVRSSGERVAVSDPRGEGRPGAQ